MPPALRVLLRQDWLNSNPPDGTGWYHSAIAPVYGSKRIPKQAPVQPFNPHHPLPQQQMLWQQGPVHLRPIQQQQHGFLRPMHHAQQPYPPSQHAQQAQFVQQQHPWQQHMVTQQPRLAGQTQPLPPPPTWPQPMPAQQPAQPPFLPGHNSRSAGLSMSIPTSLPGTYK